MSLHQTYIDDVSCVLESPLGSGPASPSLASDSEVEGSPTLLGPTPPSKGNDNMSRNGSSSSRRRLLESFSADRIRHDELAKGGEVRQAQRENNLANEVPRWESEFRAESGLDSCQQQEDSFLTRPEIFRKGKRKRPAGNITPSGLYSTPSTSSSGSSSRNSTPSNNNDILQQILVEVRSSNQMLKEKVTLLEKTVAQLQNIPSTKRPKLSPSREERDVVRKVYRSLCESDEDFGWNMEETFSSSENQAVVVKLVENSLVLLPNSTAAMVKEAARTYYNSAAGTQRLKTSGKYNTKCVQQRRRNRLKRKLTSRQVALQKSTSTSEKDKEKWKECLIEELISSEDSEEDGTFIVRPLPWRAEKVSNFFCGLDKKKDKKRSKKSKMMTFERRTGLPSSRAKPEVGSVPSWTITE